MPTHRVLILGTGAAGSAAARILAQHESLDITLIGRSGAEPYTRMLIKSVAIGSTPPEVTRLPLPDVRFIADTVVSVDAASKRVLLRSGRMLAYDSLIVATGSTPRDLPADVADADAAQAGGFVTVLHSLKDALHIRRTLGGDRKRHVLVYGGGATAAETASLLADAGHTVSLISRSAIPGETAFGRELALRIARLHHDRVTTRFGSALASVRHDASTVTAHLADGDTLTGDLLVVAMGTIPLPPPPWDDAIEVDDRQQTSTVDVWAAGGVTSHIDARGPWRIDHWEDSAAQGSHAAHHLLHTRGLGSDPGPYLPRSSFLALIHGHMLSGVGLTSVGSARREPGDELIVVQEGLDGIPVGASGLDALLAVHQWRDRLHTTA